MSDSSTQQPQDAQPEPRSAQQTESASTPEQPDAAAEEPTLEDLQEPSTEKDPGEEPKAEHPHDPEPSHRAIGIGVIDTPEPEPGDANS